MEAINKAERTTSITNFTVVYVLIIAIPIIMAFFAGTRRSSGGGSAKAVSEQDLLSKRMESLQQNVADMKALDQDTKRPGPNSSTENWTQWLDEADKQNDQLKQAVSAFRSSREFTGARDKMRQSACTYLDAVYYERRVHLENLKALRGVKNEAAVIQQLQSDNQRLQSEKNNLQNTVNMQNAMMAQQASNGGGGGGAAPNTQALADLKWQLRFEDADCKKSQADLLAVCNDAVRRKQLYSSAKANFQQIAQLARTSYTLQRQASVKVREIDQTVSRL